jgi:predicted nucleic acid-binding protein
MELLILDNNSLFSIMNPKSVSAYLFASVKAEFIAPEDIKIEFNKHKEECLLKSRLSEQEFGIRQIEVEESIKLFKLPEYKQFLKKALKELKDPNDAPYLALALLTNSAIWSNDQDLNEQSLVTVFTTEDLLIKFLKGEI